MRYTDTLKNLSHSGRVKYCEKHLLKLGAGSGRVVFRLSDTSVLKIAKNSKGLAQNKAEADLFYDGYFSQKYTDMVAKVYDSATDYTWLEMELVSKIKPSEFRKQFGIPILDFRGVLNYLRDQKWFTLPKVYEGYKEGILEDSNPALHLLIALCEDLYYSFSYVLGDFGRISSFGKVEDRIVLVDYGLTMEVFERYYGKYY